MIECSQCGAKVRRREMAQHMALHAPAPVQMVSDQEGYWRDRISQEILGERLALDYETRPTHHRTLEGLEMAADLAKEGL